ncbi:hypothetical protein CBOM_06502 [Ceraceosorus bombacis]|uniref:Uncharacterized protein n=1 Tax=Ceraceosorus bombacis TaxID=401625 RepID=A0A0P1BJI9_9BASI|nr:hypothetical protein CBOM_06502 [Ceraceosorus bombacis]
MWSSMTESSGAVPTHMRGLCTSNAAWRGHEDHHHPTKPLASALRVLFFRSAAFDLVSLAAQAMERRRGSEKLSQAGASSRGASVKRRAAVQAANDLSLYYLHSLAGVSVRAHTKERRADSGSSHSRRLHPVSQRASFIASDSLQAPGSASLSSTRYRGSTVSSTSSSRQPRAKAGPSLAPTFDLQIPSTSQHQHRLPSPHSRERSLQQSGSPKICEFKDSETRLSTSLHKTSQASPSASAELVPGRYLAERYSTSHCRREELQELLSSPRASEATRPSHSHEIWSLALTSTSSHSASAGSPTPSRRSPSACDVQLLDLVSTSVRHRRGRSHGQDERSPATSRSQGTTSSQLLPGKGGDRIAQTWNHSSILTRNSCTATASSPKLGSSSSPRPVSAIDMSPTCADRVSELNTISGAMPTVSEDAGSATETERTPTPHWRSRFEPSPVAHQRKASRITVQLHRRGQSDVGVTSKSQLAGDGDVPNREHESQRGPTQSNDVECMEVLIVGGLPAAGPTRPTERSSRSRPRASTLSIPSFHPSVADPAPERELAGEHRDRRRSKVLFQQKLVARHARSASRSEKGEVVPTASSRPRRRSKKPLPLERPAVPARRASKSNVLGTAEVRLHKDQLEWEDHTLATAKLFIDCGYGTFSVPSTLHEAGMRWPKAAGQGAPACRSARSTGQATPMSRITSEFAEEVEAWSSSDEEGHSQDQRSRRQLEAFSTPLSSPRTAFGFSAVHQAQGRSRAALRKLPPSSSAILYERRPLPLPPVSGCDGSALNPHCSSNLVQVGKESSLLLHIGQRSTCQDLMSRAVDQAAAQNMLRVRSSSSISSDCSESTCASSLMCIPGDEVTVAREGLSNWSSPASSRPSLYSPDASPSSFRGRDLPPVLTISPGHSADLNRTSLQQELFAAPGKYRKASDHNSGTAARHLTASREGESRLGPHTPVRAGSLYKSAPQSWNPSATLLGAWLGDSDDALTPRFIDPFSPGREPLKHEPMPVVPPKGSAMLRLHSTPVTGTGPAAGFGDSRSLAAFVADAEQSAARSQSTPDAAPTKTGSTFFSRFERASRSTAPLRARASDASIDISRRHGDSDTSRSSSPYLQPSAAASQSRLGAKSFGRSSFSRLRASGNAGLAALASVMDKNPGGTTSTGRAPDDSGYITDAQNREPAAAKSSHSLLSYAGDSSSLPLGVSRSGSRLGLTNLGWSRDRKDSSRTCADQNPTRSRTPSISRALWA